MDKNDKFDWERFATARFMKALFNHSAKPEDYAHRMNVLLTQISVVDDPAMLREMLDMTLRKLQQIVPKSMTDTLTGLVNRATYDERARQLCANNREYSLLIIDIDHFKSFNDRFGHDNGDHVLHTTAKRIQNAVREGDIVARYGGEEMVVILPDTSLDDAKRVAEKLRAQVASGSLSARQGDTPLPNVTVSIGVAERYTGETEDEVFKRADNALYAAKNNGRNCVMAMDPPALPPLPVAGKGMVL